MTWFNCVNCLFAAFAPIALYSRGTGLAPEISINTHYKTLFFFILTFGVKFALEATVADGSHELESSILSDILVSFTGLIDVLGMYYLLDKSKGDVNTRIPVCSIGWMYASTICSKMIPIIAYSRAPSADSYWLIFSLRSIPQLFYTLSSFYSVFMALCTKGRMNVTHLHFIHLLCNTFYPTLFKIIFELVHIDGWINLLLDSIFSIALYLDTKHYYNKMMNSNGKKKN
ncbi:hypothetical protein WA158_004910 [Blastocystis sp. Blastoise]